MQGLLYCKYSKPYLIHKNILYSKLYYYNKKEKKNKDFIVSPNDTYKYVSKNGKIIGDIEYEIINIDIEKNSYRELQELMKISDKSLEEIIKALNNKIIGQALYVKEIKLYNEEKELSNICIHKRDNWLKTTVELPIYNPQSSIKVYKRGEVDEKNSQLMIVLTSQEIYELLSEKTKVIFKSKV